MKKIILILSVLLFSASTINAQDFGFGPRIGFNASKITKSGKDGKLGLNIGAFADVGLTNSLSIEVAAMFSQQGIKGNTVDFSGRDIKNSMRVNYVNIPVVAKFNIIGGLNVFAGPQFSALTSATFKTDKVKVNLKEAFTKGDVGGIIGVGYQFNFGLNVAANYNFGFVDMVSDTYKLDASDEIINRVKPFLDDLDGKNSTWQFTVGWRF